MTTEWDASDFLAWVSGRAFRWAADPGAEDHTWVPCTGIVREEAERYLRVERELNALKERFAKELEEKE